MFVHAVDHLKLPHPQGKLLWLIYTYPGVGVFFLISGFLITQSYFNCKDDAALFFSRRAARIFPALFVNVAALCLFLFLCGNFYPGFWEGLFVLPWLAVSVLFGSDYFGFLLLGSPFHWQGLLKNFPSGVLWSISAELGFYLLTPIVFAAAVRSRGLLYVSLVFWAVVSLAINVVMSRHGSLLPPTLNATLQCSPFPYFWVFLIGALFQRIWPHIRRYIVGRALLWVPAYLLVSYYFLEVHGISVLDYRHADFNVILRLVFLMSALLSVAYTLPKTARVLGGVDLSYGLYLWHMPWIYFLQIVGAPVGTWGWFIVASGSLALAAASWFLVEKPSLAQKDRLGRAMHGAASALRRAGHVTLRVPGGDRLRQSASMIRPGTFGLAFSVAAWSATAGLGYHVWDAAMSRKVDGVPRGTAVFTASAISGRQNWDVVGGATATSDNVVITLTGNMTQWSTQLISLDVPPGGRGEYILDYDIETTNGHMGIGVLDAAPNGQWIHTLPRIIKPNGALRFRAGRRTMKIAIFNSNVTPTQTVARIRKLTVHTVP